MPSVALLIALNHAFYGLLWEKLGPRKAALGVGLHVVHHLSAVAASPLALWVYLQHGARARTMSNRDHDALVLGGGPAGLTAGYLFAKSGVAAAVVEAQGQVGGLAQTVEIDGYRFDLGGHRFFTKSPEVETLWHEVMGEEFLLRPRRSRIYWHGKLLEYPLEARDVITKAGPCRALPGRPLIYLGCGDAEWCGGDLRGLGVQPLRPPSLRAVLQVLHGEGLGRTDH